MADRRHHQNTIYDPMFTISMPSLAVCILPFPAIGLFLCVCLSLYYNFESSTATHCRVANYLPSLSAAIGGNVPQKYIWRICIALHCAPRFMLALVYGNYYSQFRVQTLSGLYPILVKLNTFLNICENMSLVALTYISSNEDRDIHEVAFIAFMVCSQTHMLLSCILYKWSHTGKAASRFEQTNFKRKCGYFIFNFAIFMQAVYFYFRHNAYCESGVYTMFALCEYLVVFTNMGFHTTIVRDFPTGRLVFDGGLPHGKVVD